jgi:macrolide phosphotransferase
LMGVQLMATALGHNRNPRFMKMLDTPSKLFDAAARHGLHLGSDIRLDASGADFVVAHALDDQDRHWVLRSPRRADVLKRARTEHAALQLVHRELPVAVPEWQVFSSELIAYLRLPGEPAATIDMEAGGYVWRFDAAAPPAAFLGSLAHTLVSLHTVPRSRAAAVGLPIEEPVQVREQWSRRMVVAREMLEVPDSVWLRWQNWLAEDSYWPSHTVLIHGDLHPPHILIDEEHRVVGLLDWTEARVSDPATDFTLLFATLGREAVETVLRQYQRAGARISPRMLDHIEESWHAYPAVLAEFARESGERGPRELAQALIAGAS